MKKLSLFSLLGLTGLLAFVATPIYAQEENAVLSDEQVVADDVEDVVADGAEDLVADTENIVADTENIVAEAEGTVIDDDFDYGDDDEITLEYVDEENVDDNEADLDTAEDDVVLDDNESEGELTEIEDALHKMAIDLGLTEEQATLLTGFLIGFGLGGLVVFGIVSLILALLGIIALWKTFKRAGEAGWKAIIPVYNTYIMYKIAGMKSWFWYSLIIAVVLAIVGGCLQDYKDMITYISQSICGIISIVATFLFARKYGWGTFASILYVIFNPICVLILGFGNYPYEGKSNEETVVEA